ncbi:MAG: nucleotidyltransferase family protein [Alcanivoracaceae bacterium]|nr:nucleotidyltransferase family protein [Alcanivoracaceae bacterium]
MNEFLRKLIACDTKRQQYSTYKQIIHQGLAPIRALDSTSRSLQKANLLEIAKLQNWQNKAAQLFAELIKNNVKFLVFKGFSYTYLLYDESNIRPYSDIDILINKVDYYKVDNILTDLNYQCYPSRQGQFISFQNSFFDNHSPQTVIDLHWQINNRIEFHKHFQFADLYINAIYINSKNLQFKTLNHIDAFILGCFHYQAHRAEDRKHIWLYDLALLWHNMNRQTQTDCLTKAKARKQSTIIVSTLKQLNETFSNCLKVNDMVISQNTEATEDYLQVRNKKITDIKIRLKNIKGINNKIKFFSEYIFQNHEYMLRRYNLKSQRWVYLYYPKMWLEDLMKLFK